MEKTRIVLDPAYKIAEVDPRVFGGFLEHMGRSIYEGVYDPQSSQADENGFRKDVLNALQHLRMTAMRYPGGNFASGYHWMDGIGPKNQRPTVRELAWQSIEPNQFGTDEFIKMAGMMDWTSMFCVNLGTGGPEEARNWVEYCNSPVGTLYANMRAMNGSETPHNVNLWCLGNEMDGPWQLGHVPADQYAIRAQQAAKLMKDTDPGIETVACGTCAITLPTYIEWDRTVLEYMGPFADYISLHRYVGNPEGDTADYLAVTNSIDQQIEEMDAVCRYVQARNKSKKRHYLCFDEWNVWYRTHNPEHTNGRGKFAPPLIEEHYNLEDALVVAGFLNSFIRHADSVKIANLAQVVNVIAPIFTRGDELLLQTIFYPFAMYSSRRSGVAIQPAVIGPGYDSPSYGRVNTIDASAILGDGLLHTFLVNRSTSEFAEVEIDHAGGRIESVKSGEVVSGTDPNASNTFEKPNTICSQPLKMIKVNGGKASLQLAPLSVTAISFIVS
jgi:alpha-N-arabinofuranosidase